MTTWTWNRLLVAVAVLFFIAAACVAGGVVNSGNDAVLGFIGLACFAAAHLAPGP